jgi:hypothetical protein
VAELLPDSFRNAHLFDADGEVQLTFSKKGKPMLRVTWPSRHREAAAAAAMTARRSVTWSCRGRSCATWA